MEDIITLLQIMTEAFEIDPGQVYHVEKCINPKTGEPFLRSKLMRDYTKQIVVWYYKRNELTYATTPTLSIFNVSDKNQIALAVKNLKDAGFKQIEIAAYLDMSQSSISGMYKYMNSLYFKTSNLFKKEVAV